MQNRCKSVVFFFFYFEVKQGTCILPDFLTVCISYKSNFSENRDNIFFLPDSCLNFILNLVYKLKYVIILF